MYIGSDESLALTCCTHTTGMYWNCDEEVNNSTSVFESPGDSSCRARSPLLVAWIWTAPPLSLPLAFIPVPAVCPFSPGPVLRRDGLHCLHLRLGILIESLLSVYPRHGCAVDLFDDTKSDSHSAW